MKRPLLFKTLVGLLIFLSVGGVYGGTLMLIDPTGKLLQMHEILPLLPVPNYLLPGFFLLMVMGIIPMLLVFGLIKKPSRSWVDRIFGWNNFHWAWTGTVILGFVLIGWLAFQAWLIGFHWPIQYITLANGALIVATALCPSIRAHFKVNRNIS